MEPLYSDSESRRFGLRVFRATAAALDPSAVRAALLRHSPDLVMLRVPAGAVHELADLEQIGVPVIVADTLVRYQADLEVMTPQPLRHTDLEFVGAGAEELEGLIRRIFADYVNHYRANPMLPAGGLVEGYVEWALGFAGGGADAAAWVLRRHGEPVAFAACSFSEGESQVVLNGVVPAESDRGIYRDLVRHLVAESKDRGCRRMHASTQVQNFPVQAVWVGEGFRLRGAEVTLHLNALLDWARQSPQCTDCVWSREDLEGGGPWATGRLIDAVAAGFGGEVPEGRQASPHTVRHFAVRPLRAGERYRARFRACGPAPFRSAVLQVADEAGELVHQAYYQFPATARG